MAERLSPDQLAQLRRNPFEYQHLVVVTTSDGYGHPPQENDTWCLVDADEDDGPVADGMPHDDALFAAAAINALPGLLDEIDRLQAENDRLREHGCPYVAVSAEGTAFCRLAAEGAN